MTCSPYPPLPSELSIDSISVLAVGGRRSGGSPQRASDSKTVLRFTIPLSFSVANAARLFPQRAALVFLLRAKWPTSIAVVGGSHDLPCPPVPILRHETYLLRHLPSLLCGQTTIVEPQKGLNFVRRRPRVRLAVMGLPMKLRRCAVPLTLHSGFFFSKHGHDLLASSAIGRNYRRRSLSSSTPSALQREK